MQRRLIQLGGSLIGPLPLVAMMFALYSPPQHQGFISLVAVYLISMVLFWPGFAAYRLCKRMAPSLWNISAAVPMAVGAMLSGLIICLIAVLTSWVIYPLVYILLFVMASFGTFVGLIAYETLQGTRIRWLPHVGT